MERKADLLVGSDIGRWIVGSVDSSAVGTVVTWDDEIATMAASRGMRVARSFPPVEPARRALSAHWPELLSAVELDMYETAWNIHPGLLPWGRGYAPVFWALWAGEPAGATLHLMTPALDRGPIIEQIQVDVHAEDTGWTLYRRVLQAREALFEKWWPRLVAGESPPALGQPDGGSYHGRRDFLRMRDEPDLAGMSATDLVRLARALAMPGMPGPRVAPGERLALVEDSSLG